MNQYTYELSYAYKYFNGMKVVALAYVGHTTATLVVAVFCKLPLVKRS